MNFLVLISWTWLLGLITLIAYCTAVEIFQLKRYSLRSLLIVMTFLAIALGASAAFIRG